MILNFISDHKKTIGGVVLNKRKYNTVIVSIVGLMVIAGGMIAYQDMYLNKQAQADQGTIYLADTQLQAHTIITPTMFKAVTINKNSILPGEVQNINQVSGKMLRGGLLQGEPLFSQRLEKANPAFQGDLSLEVNPTYSPGLAPNETVNVYAVITNQNNNSTVVKELFQKRVTSVVGGQSVVGAATNQPSAFMVNATPQDVNNYYTALQVGKIVVTPVNSLDVGSLKVGSTGTSIPSAQQFNASSPIVQQAVNQNPVNTSSQSVMSYVVQKGDTLGTLAMKFKTSDMTLSDLNNGLTQIKPGETITVPAN